MKKMCLSHFRKCFWKTLTGVLILLMFVCAGAAGYAAEAAPEASPAPEAETAEDAKATSPAARPAPKNLGAAADTAEKMYYSGELYLFADSMAKINYEMAAVAANLKEYVRAGALRKDGSLLDDLTEKYNRTGVIYNSWVDVRGDLEYFIQVVDDKTIFTKTNLQSAFRLTLTTIRSTRALLEDGRAYVSDAAAVSRRAVTAAADATVQDAAKANAALEAYMQKTVNGYRALFDEFSRHAGIPLEYRTGQDPEAEQDATAPETEG
jgi:hypothetical protein